jgi:hypothetical protein
MFWRLELVNSARTCRSGEGGIRTLGALLELGALAKLCFRPLSHLTIEVQEPKYSGNYGKRQTPNGQWIGALPNN